jgi:hypothetical protein
MELYYVEDIHRNVKNISTTLGDANKFLEKSLKNAGTVYVALVNKEDYDSGKVTTSSIRNLNQYIN